jgi:poly(hydroxyalkanoate) granule-associated protein
MSETDTSQGVATGTGLRDDLFRAGRDMWLASLGMVAAVGEEARSVFETLVERGKAVEARSDTTTVGRAMGEMGQQVKDLGQRMEDGLQQTSRAVLHRFGVPSHAEIQTLIARVEHLSEKIDRIRKEAVDVQEN